MKRALLVVLVVAFSSPAFADRIAAPAGGPKVEVLDAGKGAKKQLRFAPKVGSTSTMVMKTRMNLALTMGGRAMPATDVPETRMTMDMKVTSVSPSGDVGIAFTMKKGEVDPAGLPAAVSAMKQVLAKIEGTTGTGVVTNTGITRSADIKVPASADPQMKEMLDGIKQNMNQLAAPLPQEAVGVGAKWKVTSQISMNGMTLTQVASFELKDVKGDVVSLAVKIDQKASNQVIVKDGITVDLISADGAGSGEQLVDLTKLVPTKASMSLVSKSVMKAGGQGFDMKLTLGMDIESK
ncbi:MAG: hypothetical protein KIT31_27395 [Deltaproteobacteria bacterium]|nr:hypothetical protein [Deltaproteobacteria bacterium]